MKDLHTHILYDVDDGPRLKEESIKIIKKAYDCGVTDIVLTPHYIHGTIYNANNRLKQKLFRELKEEVQSNGININLYLGNEIYLGKEIYYVSLNKEFTTINGSRYILIELSLYNKCSSIDELIDFIISKGFIPIISHPERYLAYYKDYAFFMKLLEKGCLFQGNIGSIYGLYGRKSKIMLKAMLKKKMIHFIASDVHFEMIDIYEKDIENELLKIVKDKNVVGDLLVNNADKVLNDLDLIRNGVNYDECK